MPILLKLARLTSGNGGVAPLTSGNLKLIINKCPGRVVREKIERLAQIRGLPGELLKKGFEAGLDPNIRIPARVYHRNRWQTAQYPLLWHLVENRSISAIGAALKAGADQERMDHTGVFLREKIKSLRTGGRSDRSPHRTYRR